MHLSRKRWVPKIFHRFKKPTITVNIAKISKKHEKGPKIFFCLFVGELFIFENCDRVLLYSMNQKDKFSIKIAI